MALIVGTNSWGSLAEAELYFGDRIDTEGWTALPDDATKSKFLVSAFRWIYNDPMFDVPVDSEESSVKEGQFEAVLFLVNYSKEYEKRAALISMGVEKFQYSKWTENLGELSKPMTIINYFSKAGFYNGGISRLTLVDPSELT